MKNSLALIFALLVPAVLAAPTTVAAFGGGGEGCGAGTCSECHSMDRSEAEKLLKGLVDKVQAVDFAIVPGLWKVDFEKQGKRGVVFIDFSKSYAVSGGALRLSDWTDVTAMAAAGSEPVDFSSIPLKDTLRLGSAGAAVKAIVFTDPKCPFCQKLHAELKEIVRKNPDIAFYLKLFPLKSHPESYGISKAIICESSMELLELSFEGKPVPEPSCETAAVDETLAVAARIGVKSTPTIILQDGRVIPGFRPAGKLLEILRAPANP